jgi:hypothetical protein
MAQAHAQRGATQAQTRAINKQRDYLFKNLNPDVMQPAVLAADTARAKNQLALQGQIDPNLRAGRDVATAQMLDELSKNGLVSGQVAEQATKEAMQGPQAVQSKNALIDAAMAHLAQGATLPPDVQAELVQAGLEKSGAATGRATGQGMGGTMLRTILGQAGVNLQMQRQQQAQNLLASASNLEAQRQNVLTTLFPRLSSLQSENLARSGGVFATSQGAMPNAGMSGTDVANIWLARVGAANSLTQQQGNVNANNALAMGSVRSGQLGSAGVNLNQAIDIGKKLWSSNPSSSSDYGYGGADMGATSAETDAAIYDGGF